jgi:hypothetical protein
VAQQSTIAISAGKSPLVVELRNVVVMIKTPNKDKVQTKNGKEASGFLCTAIKLDMVYIIGKLKAQLLPFTFPSKCAIAPQHTSVFPIAIRHEYVFDAQ